MSKIAEKVSEYLIKFDGGQVEALDALAGKASVHRDTLRRWIRDGFPNAQGRYKLALACGCSEEEALEIAKECLPKAAG